MDLTFRGAIELAGLIRSGQASAADVLEAHLAQIEKHNESLNAIVTLDADAARAAAREADRARARGVIGGPLHGVPFTLKDCHAVAGMRTTAGYPPLARHVPKHDSTVTARLKDAGAILIGRTNVPVLLADIQTCNPIFGRTSNPWDTARTPGGSSGGAVAALATGMTPFEVGSDLAGSIRVPAHFCGVYGFKPTENRVPVTGMIPDLPGSPRTVRVMGSIGPLARNVDDLVALLAIIEGPDGFDTEVPPPECDPVPAMDLKGLRVAIATTFPGFPVAKEVAAAVMDLAGQLATAGAIVEEAPLPGLDFCAELKAAQDLTAITTATFQPEAKGPRASLKDYLVALHQRDQSIAAWERFFGEWDVLLCPPSAVTAFEHLEEDAPLVVDGHDEDYAMANAHTFVFNYSGHPAAVIPFRLDSRRLPLGVQLVGARWRDRRLLGITKAIAGITPGFRRPPLI